MKLISIKNTWLVLLTIQVVTVLYFVSDFSQYGIHNSDAFSYHVQWSKVAYTFNPFKEAILADPGHDLVRIPFSMPHFFMGIIASISNPLEAYLLCTCVGVLAAYFSLVFFGRALGFGAERAHFLALVHYTFFHILSQFPPLSGNQFHFIIDSIKLAPENIEHFGPLHYPHDMFFYPLLYTLLALTLIGVKKIKSGESIKPVHSLIWGGLCLLMPFNYFYHWFQFAFALGFIIAAGTILRWWKIKDLVKSYSFSLLIFCLVLVGWSITIFFQNKQLSDEIGYRFALMGGLTEARFFLLPVGVLVRIVLWSAAALLFLRIKPDSVLLVGFLIGCLAMTNIQLIVGKNIQPGHWTFGIDRVFAWIAILIVVASFEKFGSRWFVKLIPGLTLFTFFFFISQTVVSWKYFEKRSRWDNSRTEVINFLKTQPRSVILTPELWLDTDILIHTHHYSFLARGAQSAVSAEEQLQRVSHAAFILGYSREGLVKWLHIRSVRFFGMLYATGKDFSSSYLYDPVRKGEVVDFTTGSLPSWDWQIINDYSVSDTLLKKKLDLIVLHAQEADPVAAGEVIFRNDKYVVLKASTLLVKRWGDALPCPEKRYVAADK